MYAPTHHLYVFLKPTVVPPFPQTRYTDTGKYQKQPNNVDICPLLMLFIIIIIREYYAMCTNSQRHHKR